MILFEQTSGSVQGLGWAEIATFFRAALASVLWHYVFVLDCSMKMLVPSSCSSEDVSKSCFDPCPGGSVFCSYGIIHNLKSRRKGRTARHERWVTSLDCEEAFAAPGLLFSQSFSLA